ncbi:MAG: retropepsin-like aspartic protease [Pseudoxanthomonas sp.]
MALKTHAPSWIGASPFGHCGHLVRRAGLRAIGLSMLVGACTAHGATPSPQADAGLCALADPGPDALVQVPFETVDGRIYVAVQVNGQGPFRFAVDTGASGIARADTRLLQALSLQAQGQSSTSDGVSTTDVETVRLASLRLGALVRTDVEVITRDYGRRSAADAKFDGILAREFFADGLLVIDYPRKRLSFTRASALRQGSPGVLAYERAFRVPVSIGALQTVGNLDTGANVRFVLPQALYRTLGHGALSYAGRAQLTNGQVDLQRATVHGPFHIGALTLADVEVRVSDKYPELLVGAHALQSTVLLIDQRSKAVAVCP